MLRTIAFLHRYTGVAVGWLMTLWCLSGFVMMYQGYPELANAERLRGIAALDLSDCCRTPPAIPAGDLAGARINMVSGVPVLRVFGASEPLDLHTGLPLDLRTAAQVQNIAIGYGKSIGIMNTPVELAFAGIDQWTLLTARRSQSVHHLAFSDAAGTEIYVNGNSGEVIQDTNRRERTLAWMGAIPHWLYLTALRSQPRIWSQVVIWTAVTGTFLTVIGLFLGVSRLNWRGAGRKFPFRGLWNWHHIAGVFFGVLALSWVFSGLLTMNPWGLLESDDGGYAQRLRGTARWQDLQRFLVEHGPDLTRFVELRVAPINGALFVVAYRKDGSSIRLNASGAEAEVRSADIEAAAVKLGASVRSLELLRHEDSYYYGHKRPVALPVYRLVLGDDGHTHIYIDPVTGDVQTLDLNARRTRWWESALHNLDLPGLRTRPLWDLVALLLLAGVTAVCATGTWLAWRVLRKPAFPGK
jgi:hypothetical protein